jgi:hypothetical protein
MLEPHTSGSIVAAKNDNSGLAGLVINLGASKGRRSQWVAGGSSAILPARPEAEGGVLGSVIL